MEKEKETTETAENIVKTAIDFAVENQKAEVLNGILKENGFELPENLVATKKEFKIRSFQEFYPNPRRATGNISFRELESFNEYVNKHKIEKETTIQAFEDDMVVKCTINDHSDNPGWRDHTACLNLEYSNQWKIWKKFEKEAMGQIHFADFIEDNRVDFQIGYEDPESGFKNITPGALMVMVDNFKETRKKTVDSSVSRIDGSYVFIAKEEKEGGKTNEIKVPEKFVLAIPVLKGGHLVTVHVRLRYKTDVGKVNFYYIIDQKDKLIENSFQKIRDRIENGVSDADECYLGTGIKVWL